MMLSAPSLRGYNSGTGGVHTINCGVTAPGKEDGEMKKRWALALTALLTALTLASCGAGADRSAEYDVARDLYDAGRYAEAAEAFDDLGRYRDSEDLVLKSKNMASYTRAGELMDAGDYSAAAELFEDLGDFSDAPSRAREARSAASYKLGGQLLEAGDRSGAADAFEAAGSYLDAPSLARELRNALAYDEALELTASGDLDLAREKLAALGSYRDAPDRLRELDKLETYLSALDSLDSGDYSRASSLFSQLGDFRDSPEMAEYARELPGIESDYREAQRLSSGSGADLWRAGELLLGIMKYGYSDTETLLEDVSARVMAPINARLDAGDFAAARDELRAVKASAPEFGSFLWDHAVYRESLDYERYYDGVVMDYPHMDSFSTDTPAIDYVRTFIYMYLNGIEKIDLEPTPGTEVPDSFGDNFNAIIDANWSLIDCIMGEYCGFYAHRLSWWYSGGHMTKLEFDISYGTGYTMDEIEQHIDTFDRFCEDSLRLLNENLLIGRSMSYEQRSRVIYDWCVYWLDYDDPMTIHDPGIAVESRFGVCECYTAIFNRMCCLAGVPTFAQTGVTGEYIGQDDPAETHIWSVQLDEQGDIIYTDSTWGDQFTPTMGGTNLEAAVMDFENTCFGSGADADRWSRTENYRYRYFWNSQMFSDHVPFFEYPYDVSLWDPN